MISRSNSAILKTFTAILLCFMIASTSVYSESMEVKLIQQLTPIKCNKMTFGKSYTFQLKTDSMNDSHQWEYFHGDIPKGIVLESKGFLQGIPREFAEKTFTFWVKAWDQADPYSIYIYQVNLEFENSKQPEENGGKEKVYWKPTERLRLIAGYEMLKPSGTTGENNGFVDVYLSQKFPGGSKDFWKRLSIWGNLRLTSIPIKSTKNIGSVTSPDYFQSLNTLKMDEVAQAGEFLLGLELALGQTFFKGREYTIGFTMSAGGVAPINSPGDSIMYYEIPEELKVRYENKTYFAIVPPRYNRFYRQYYVGLRLKSYEEKKEELPAMLDIMFGMNAATSGGKNKFLRKGVIRIDGFLPLNLIKDDMIYIFGSVVLNTSNRSPIPFKFGSVDTIDLSEINIDPSEVLVRLLPENDRDYYRIGIGIELSKIFSTK